MRKILLFVFVIISQHYLYSQIKVQKILDSVPNNISMDILGQFWIIKDNSLYNVNIINDSISLNKFKKIKGLKTVKNVLRVNSKEIIFLDNEALKILKKDKINILTSLQLQNVDMALASDTSIYIWGKSKKTNSYDLLLYNFINNKLTKLSTFKYKINAVLGDGEQTMISVNNKIYWLSEKFGCLLMYENENDIISFTNSNMGDIFFATQTGLYYLTNNLTQLYKVATMRLSKLWYFDNQLYALSENKSLVRIAPVNNFRDILLPDIHEQNIYTIDNAQKLIRKGKIIEAIYVYSQIVKKDTTNVEVREEYAYALALGGMFDGALLNLDKRWKTKPTPQSYFYASQVFALMGYDTLANKIQQDSVPSWIADKYSNFVSKYKREPHLYGQDSISFSEINALSEKGMNFKALVCFDRLVKEYPNVYIIHAGYSIVLEKIGLKKFAAEELNKCIKSMPQNDTTLNSTKKSFEQHYAKLTGDTIKSVNTNPNVNMEKIKKYNPQMMLYAGGIFSTYYVSFNSRFGVFVSNKFSASANFGLSGSFGEVENPVSFNLGLSGYYRIKNVFFIGFGFSEMIGGGTSTFSINPSVGVSLMNKNKTSSWDIFMDLSIPFAEGYSTIFGISIGKSFYLGRRR
ncbi:MAG: hypothetical protein LBR28_06610 [Bacteroidales bacterium]|jgi:tetratricopeptide (TPR) repeat protein|nr:hypothetical protein [Bacteroidales bacterium]